MISMRTLVLVLHDGAACCMLGAKPGMLGVRGLCARSGQKGPCERNRAIPRLHAPNPMAHGGAVLDKVPTRYHCGPGNEITKSPNEVCLHGGPLQQHVPT
jgi:hypothetical protein